jgi:glutamate/tyrosine decarboxylase-like PLP-dependent enzyme
VIALSTREALEETFRHALNYLEDLDRNPVAVTTTPEELRVRLAKSIDDGVSPAVVVKELIADVRSGLLGSTGGRFFGWVRGGSLPAALAADWLTSVWDQNAALYSTAPAAAIVEETVGAWLKTILRLPADASFALVTGLPDGPCNLPGSSSPLLAFRAWMGRGTGRSVERADAPCSRLRRTSWVD